MLLSFVCVAVAAVTQLDIKTLYPTAGGESAPVTPDVVADINSYSSNTGGVVKSSKAIFVWPPEGPPIPGEEPGKFGNETYSCLTKGVPVAECKDRGVYTVTLPTLTPFMVPNADSAVIVSPGGGYGFLAIDREGTDIAAWLNSIGVSAFVLKYRVPGRSWLPFGGAPLMDAQRSMGLVRGMAAAGKYPGLNASKIGFMGFSAGGHLTGHLNVAWQKRAYPRVDAADDLPCRPDFAIMVYPWQSVSQAPVNEPVTGASAMNVTKDTPPTMLIQAEDDPVHVENAFYYYVALHDQNAAPSNMHLYPRGGHGYGRCTVNQAAAKTFYDVCTWPDRGTQFLQKLGAAPKKSIGSMPKEDDDDDGDEEEEEGRVVDAFYAKPLASNAGETGSRSIDSSEIPLWPAGKVPEEHPGAYPAKEAVSCLTKHTPLAQCKDKAITNVTVPTLTPFLVPNSAAAVIIGPGGAYRALAFDREGTDIAAWLNSIGVSAFVLKYRVPGRSWLPFGGAPLMDAQRSMGLVRGMAAAGKYPGLNASKIGFMGFSAGGHLTGHLNVAWQKRTYPRVDAADDLPCRPDFAIMVYPWRSVSQAPVNESIAGASAMNVTKDTPPTMLIQAEDDPVHVENSLYYFMALKQKGAAPSELHNYPRGGHGYGRCTVVASAAKTFYDVCTWPERGQLFLQRLGAAKK